MDKLRKLLMTDFASFFYWAMRNLRLEPKVYGLVNDNDSTNYLLDLIALCRDVTKHTHKYYTISICPSAGKTLLMQFFILFTLVRNPFSKILVYSYSATPANEYNSNIAYWVDTPMFASMFPHLTIDPTLANRSRTRFLRYGKRAGELLTDGIMGTTTGFRAGSDAGQELLCEEVRGFSGMIVIDDPIKASDSDSPAERESTWRAIENGILNRGNKSDTPIVMIMQRLHKDDPIGRMVNKFGDTGLLHSLTVKALRDDGRSICETKISTQALLIEKEKNFPYFSAQYQQEPLSDNNKVFDISKISELLRDINKDDLILHSFITVDTALKDKKTSDFTVFSHFYIIASPDYKNYIVRDKWGKKSIPDYHNSNIIKIVLNEVLVERIPAHRIVARFDEFLTNIIKSSLERPSILLIEEQASGDAIVGHLKEKRGDPKFYDGYTNFSITGFRPHTAKLDRFRKASPHVSSGLLLLKHQKHRLGDYVNVNNTNTAILNHLDLIENTKDNDKDDIADTICSAIDFTFYNIVDSEGRKLGRLFYDCKNRLLNSFY